MKFRRLIYLSLLLLFIFSSCQNEESEIINPSQDEIIEGNSTTASLMSRTASNDGSEDNIIDYANCLEVVLPVTVTANGVTITIESFTDFDALQALLEAFTNDDDEVVITFPITVILNDYTELVVNNQAELDAQIENCNGENEDDDDIECVDFQYPIVFSIYNTDFQVTETVTIANDEALYLFLETLNGPVLASLNFPVILILANGDTIEVNNNQELEIAISEAEDGCDEDDDYDFNDDVTIENCDLNLDMLENQLLECNINASSFDLSGGAIDLNYLNFEADGIVIVNGTPTVTETASWSVYEDNSSYILSINGLVTFDLLNGDWLLLGCQEDILVFQQEAGNDTIVLQLEQDCEVVNDNPFECFESFDATVVGCDYNNDGFGEFDLATAFANCENSEINLTYHETLSDAQNNVNALTSPYNNIISLPQTIYARVELISNGSFEIFEVALLLENCNTSGCSQSDVDSYLVECLWNVVNFNGSDDLIIYDMDFEANSGIVVIFNGTTTIDAYWSTTTTSDGVWLEFSSVNGPNIQAINGNWLIVECESDRLQLQKDGDIMVIEQDCN